MGMLYRVYPSSSPTGYIHPVYSTGNDLGIQMIVTKSPLTHATKKKKKLDSDTDSESTTTSSTNNDSDSEIA